MILTKFVTFEQHFRIVKYELNFRKSPWASFTRKDISAFYNFTDQVNNENKLIKICAMTSVSANKVRCNRCGTIHIKTNVKLPIGAFFCPTCLELGRVRSDEYFYHLPQQDFPEKNLFTLEWKINRKSRKNF